MASLCMFNRVVLLSATVSAKNSLPLVRQWLHIQMLHRAYTSQHGMYDNPISCVLQCSLCCPAHCHINGCTSLLSLVWPLGKHGLLCRNALAMCFEFATAYFIQRMKRMYAKRGDIEEVQHYHFLQGRIVKLLGHASNACQNAWRTHRRSFLIKSKVAKFALEFQGCWCCVEALRE